MLAAAVQTAGFDFVDLGIAPDTPVALEQLVKKGLEHDILITSGGVSMGDSEPQQQQHIDSFVVGEKDFLKPVVKGLGGTIHFGRINMKPGKPTTFATVPLEAETKRVFALPGVVRLTTVSHFLSGNPVSCMVTFYLFVVPALRWLAGHSNPNLQLIKAKIKDTVSLCWLYSAKKKKIEKSRLINFQTLRYTWMCDQNTSE